MPQPSSSALASSSPPLISASLDDKEGASTTEPVTFQFLSIAWTPIPQSWKPSFEDGKIRLSSPDSSDPSDFKLRTDVLVKLTTDEEGETAVLYKRKPSSVLQSSASKVSTATLVDTAETVLRVPAINVREPPEPLRIANASGLSLPEVLRHPITARKSPRREGSTAQEVHSSGLPCQAPRSQGPHRILLTSCGGTHLINRSLTSLGSLTTNCGQLSQQPGKTLPTTWPQLQQLPY